MCEVAPLASICATRLLELGLVEDRLTEAGTPDATIRGAQLDIGERVARYRADGPRPVVTKGRLRRVGKGRPATSLDSRMFYVADADASGDVCFRCRVATDVVFVRAARLTVSRRLGSSAIYLRSRPDADRRAFPVCTACRARCRFRNVVCQRRVYAFNPFEDSDLVLADADALPLA